nr:MAG TPA: hypothetical protein [Caudoviricetes sp.]DAH34615.1 MAG TPA: hypothetical protein [Bacteriophage sp.]DAM52535.1 MAG TPA: hypothetical protein [Caudoviricetes sp.]DAT66698.1 MAG TPA: hypothetical protein [Caudoviricetes sp.]DAU68005.1 MAG TPA: hypothetical protein [Caudoviricetes sp.]
MVILCEAQKWERQTTMGLSPSTATIDTLLEVRTI